MSLSVTAPKKRNNIIETYLDQCTPADREDALGYLTRPDLYAHVDLAEALSKELGYRISDMAVRGWRRRHL